MADQYETDEKANYYALFKKNLFLKHIEKPSIHKLLDYDLKGKRVIDLACGCGDSTKMLVDLNPEELVGVDYAETMINNAIKSSANDPRFSHIKYYVRDCMEPLNLGEFDIVYSSYLLNYGKKPDELLKFYKSMYASTKPSGLCCGLIMNVFLDRKEFNEPERYKKYGLEYNRHENGELLDIKLFYDNKHLFDLRNWIWPSQVHEECARKAGFKKMEWVEPILDPAFDDKDGFFDTFLKYSPIVFYKLTK